jgi:membrane protein implicated in regulation of membrane protease activity
MPASLLLTWWNLVYLVPLGLALIYVGVYAFSGLTFGDDVSVEAGTDADLHVDADADVDAEADVDADADLDADADADMDAEAEADTEVHADVESETHDLGHAHDHEPAGGSRMPFYLTALSFFGMGKVPLSIILMVLFLSWGTIGLIVNGILRNLVPADWMVALGSLPAAGVGSVFVTKAIGGALRRWLPSNETYVERKAELIGMTGEAMFDINSSFGRVSVRNRHGDLFQVPCQTYDDAVSISKGDKVLLVEYEAAEGVYYVTRYELEDPRRDGEAVTHGPPAPNAVKQSGPRVGSSAEPGTGEAVTQ